MKKIEGLLQLMRPANIVTSVSDVLAGIAISGFLEDVNFSADGIYPVVFLCISTIGLYGGGVVFNDVFDAAIDKVERPERPIPKGVVKIAEAVILGSGLLMAGILTAALVSKESCLLAASIALAALIYNKWSKHHVWAGPLNMGLCRGLNLLLGISVVISSIAEWWFLAIVPITYIAAVTIISRGEVYGGSKRTLYAAGLLYWIVVTAILLLSHARGTLWWAIIFLFPFAWMIFTALIKAIRMPAPQNIGKAVKAGVLALILMNGAWAAAFGMIGLAFLIILLLPLSLWLAKMFAVT